MAAGRFGRAETSAYSVLIGSALLPAAAPNGALAATAGPALTVDAAATLPNANLVVDVLYAFLDPRIRAV